MGAGAYCRWQRSQSNLPGLGQGGKAVIACANALTNEAGVETTCMD